MIDRRADVSGRSKADAGWRRLRNFATVCWSLMYASSSGASLRSVIESASSPSTSEWDECRLDSTRVLSSGTVSVSNVGSEWSEVELSSVLVGEGRTARWANGLWW
jgi:hypothetical protein